MHCYFKVRGYVIKDKGGNIIPFSQSDERWWCNKCNLGAHKDILHCIWSCPHLSIDMGVGDNIDGEGYGPSLFNNAYYGSTSTLRHSSQTSGWTPI